jgi:predicted MFS family arabinose efflux permease
VWGLDWRTAIGVLVSLGFVQLLLFAAVYRNSPRNHPAVNEAEAALIEGDALPAGNSTAAPSARMSVLATLRLATPRSLLNLFCLAVQTILSTFADNIFLAWIPRFLSQVHGLEFKQMGIYASLPLLGGALAGLLGGLLNDYLIAATGNRRWARTAVAFIGKGMAAALMFTALLFYDRPYEFCLLLFLVKLFGDWSLTTAWGVVTDIGGRATASVFAVNNSVAGIGLIAAPIVYGYIADRFGWPSVFASVGTVYVLCALSWLLIDCTIPVLREAEPRRAAS